MKPKDPLASKRDALRDAMKACGRWHEGYERDLASMPEAVLDDLLKYYAGNGSPIYVG